MLELYSDYTGRFEWLLDFGVERSVLRAELVAVLAG